MLRIGGGGLSESLAQGVQRHVAQAEGKTVSKQEAFEGLRVTLSEMGKAAAAAKNDNIDEADLPDNIKEILKTIRALRQQIAEKKAELQALAADVGMDPQLKQTRIETLQSELTSLQGALSGAQAGLLAALKDGRLSDGQRMQASALAAG